MRFFFNATHFTSITLLYSDVLLVKLVKNTEPRILTNDNDIWLRTKRYESVRRIDHASLTKENGIFQKKTTATSAGEKCGIDGNSGR